MMGVVAHDAGGAEIISSYIRRNNIEFNAVLGGPAIRIFRQKLGPVKNVSMEKLLNMSEWILCGTSYPSELEWRVIKLAREARKHCVAVLDHWVNYRLRFQRNGVYHFPDLVWAGDKIAFKIAQECLPEVDIELMPNAYFEDLRQFFAAQKKAVKTKTAGKKILFVCEPIREAARLVHKNPLHWGYDEDDALRYFLSNIDNLVDEHAQIIVRPHPRESENKYSWVLKEFDLPIISDNVTPLMEQVAQCDIVVGCASMAMVVGLLAGKRVVCCIPPGGKSVTLPQAEIESLQDILSSQGAGSSIN